MHDKVLQATRDLDFDPLRIAKKMTVPLNGRTVIFDGESAQAGYFDFWHYEYRVNGQTIIGSVDPIKAGLLPFEVEALKASRRAQTSFFQVEAVMPRQHQLRLRNLLEPNQPEILLTDIGLSDSMDRLGLDLALFFRPITLRGITMSSGFNFGFETERVPGILEAYRQKMRKVPSPDMSESRFIFFFQKYRRLGIDNVYNYVDWCPRTPIDYGSI